MKTLPDIQKEQYEVFVEAGAPLEHDRWARWQKYLHNHCVRDSMCNLIIPAKSVRHWESQILRDYSDLTEEEKESDRKEVREYLPLLLSRDLAIESATIERVREIVESKRWFIGADQADGEILIEHEYYHKALIDILSALTGLSK